MRTINCIARAIETGRNTMQGMRRPIARAVHGVVPRVCLTGVAILLTGCSLDNILKSEELPPDVTDPALTRTREGAIAAYYGAVGQFRLAFGGGGTDGGNTGSTVAAITGLLSDELRSGVFEGADQRPVNARSMLEGERVEPVEGVYSNLQRVRGQSTQAIELLTRFAPQDLALRGHTQTLQGYAELFLAELFCSGIPLSTVDYDGDFTLKPGSSTEEVYRNALALFESALLLAEDSTRFVHLARMGRARALLGLGELAQAAAAAAEVPNGYRYTVTFSTTANTQSFARTELAATGWWAISVADGEGLNGLDYRSSGDPRTTFRVLGTTSAGVSAYHPMKYATDGSTSIVLADWVEARLIEAEAALQAGSGDTWLTMLNALRTNGTFTTQPNASDPTRTDTLWNAGTGGVPRLAPLDDPGGADARVDLLFRERAFWLFLTGHRQGDLRRLIRQYGRTQEQLYPVGLYSSTDGSSYGADVTVPIPPAERVSNPHFTGCASRGS